MPLLALDDAAREGAVTVRLEVMDGLPGGLAIYGAHFGRYPLDPTVVFVLHPASDTVRNSVGAHAGVR